MRSDQRQPDQVRPLVLETNWLKDPPGSVLVSLGATRVLCTATVEERVPPHRQAAGGGWLSAEYTMLPGSTRERRRRDREHVDGRTVEIQRLIGRSLRAAIDLDRIGPRTIWIDCDVLQADGSTRCAAIGGGSVALALALRHLARLGAMPPFDRLLRDQVAAVSVGIVDGEIVVDLCQEEDSRADVDMNVVATAGGRLIEIQGTAEGQAFPRDRAGQMIDRALAAIAVLTEQQRRVVEISA
ncbi:MAG: ribonuclease PH [Deltaproteobacteria bacterium]|nr:ribonuclease PH [Deltaproteobacteria bacterium]